MRDIEARELVDRVRDIEGVQIHEDATGERPGLVARIVTREGGAVSLQTDRPVQERVRILRKDRGDLLHEGSADGPRQS